MFVLGLISLPISDAFIEAHKKGVYSQTVSHVDNIIEVIPERKSGTRQRSTQRDQQDFTVRKSGRGMVSRVFTV